MKNFNINIKIVFILYLTFGSVVLFAQSNNSNLFNDVNSALNIAQAQSANILCPAQYVEAINHYNNAKQFKIDGKLYIDIQTELDKSASILSIINNEVSDRQKTFGDVLSLRKAALDAGAEKYSIKYWLNAEKKFKGAIDDYSDRDYKAVQAAISQIKRGYTDAKEYADYENYLLTEWQPLKNADSLLAKLLSPGSYNKGFSKFNEALAGIADCDEMNSIKQNVNDAGIFFNMAFDDSKRFTARYPDLIQARKDAFEAEAEIYSVDLWNDGERNLTEAALSFNKNEIDDAVKFSLIAKQQYLEAKHLALRNKLLSKTDELIKECEGKAAEDYAPKTFDETKAIIKSMTGTINSDIYNYLDLKSLADSAEAKAKLTLEITNTIKSVEEGKNTWENLILGWNVFGKKENPQTIEKPIEAPPPVEKVTSPLVKKEEARVPKETVNKPAPKINKIPPQVYNEFGSGEAEFIDNGNEIIIRLTGAEFSKNSSTIKNKTKNLIDKAICAFDYFDHDYLVTAVYSNDQSVQGSNQKLSQRRAEKIRNYIALHGNTNPSQILAVGYGETESTLNNKAYKGYKKNCLVEFILRK